MPQKQKIEAGEKIEMIRKYRSHEISLRKAAREIQVSYSTFRQWVREYETEGVSAFLPNKQNKGYRAELKYAAVQEYLRGTSSQEDICKKYKIRDAHTLRDWIKVYHVHGDFNSAKHSEGGSYMKQGRETTKEERLEIVKDCLASGKNYGEMALKHRVSCQQVRTWTLKFEELGEAGLEDRRGKRKKDQEPRTELEAARIEIEQLKHKLYLAEMERDLLKKLDEIERPANKSQSPK